MALPSSLFQSLFRPGIFLANVTHCYSFPATGGSITRPTCLTLFLVARIAGRRGRVFGTLGEAQVLRAPLRATCGHEWGDTRRSIAKADCMLR
jgi:hypothetical protein